MKLFFNKLIFSIIFSCLFVSASISQEIVDDLVALHVSEIKLVGNKITKDKIIYRELLFAIGDQISKSELLSQFERSEENLLNTSLFNFVAITFTQQENNVLILIEFQERWYIWPFPVLEYADRNFSSFLENKDWTRIDYGLFLLVNNFRGRNEVLKVKTIFGYNDLFVLHYYKPYIDKKQKLGIGSEINFYQNHEVLYQIIKDKPEFIKLSDKYARSTLRISNFYTYRPFVYSKHILDFKYTRVTVNDSVINLNNNYFFDQKNEISYFSVLYNFDYDKRDSKSYPLNGYRLYLMLKKNGLGILSNKGNVEFKSIIEDNFQLTDKFFVNTSILGKININNNNSFYFSESIGYDNYLRGMEYYVSYGNNYYISKTNLKYEIIPQTNFDIGFISSKKFSKVHYALYFNLFFDTGYAKSTYIIDCKLTNEFLYTGGVGIDLVTYYDKVLRIEYSLNKFGEHGIFFHLGAPIIED